MFALAEPQSQAWKVPKSRDCFQCSIFIRLVPEGSWPTSTSQRSQLSSEGSASQICPMMSPQILGKVQQKTIPTSVSNHLNPGINSWIPRNLYHSITTLWSRRLTTLEVACLTQATGPKPKYLSSKDSTTGFRLARAMCIWMVPWLWPMQLTFCLVMPLTQVKMAGMSQSAMCWKVNSQNSLFLSGLSLVWLRECLFPRLLPNQTSQPRLASMKPGALSSSLTIQVSELSSRPCWRMRGLRPSRMRLPLRWMRYMVRMQPSQVITLCASTGQLQYLQQAMNSSFASGCAHNAPTAHATKTRKALCRDILFWRLLIVRQYHSSKCIQVYIIVFNASIQACFSVYQQTSLQISKKGGSDQRQQVFWR